MENKKKPQQNRKPSRFRAPREKSEFDQKMIDIARVTRVMKGGRRFSFRIAAVVGNRNGKVGVGVGKGGDVSMAMEKAINNAKKHMINVNIYEGTIAHEVLLKHKSARMILKPAKPGMGIIAGGTVRVVCEYAGIKDIIAKTLSKSKNKINNARAAVEALSRIKAKKPKVKKEEAKEEKKEKVEAK